MDSVNVADPMMSTHHRDITSTGRKPLIKDEHLQRQQYKSTATNTQIAEHHNDAVNEHDS